MTDELPIVLLHGSATGSYSWAAVRMGVVQGIDYLERNLRRFMRPARRHIALDMRLGSNRIEYQPLGVVGIISPWNYPVNLSLMPVVTAIAAGNRVMLKPSKLTPATNAVLASMFSELFPEEQVAMVSGDGSAFSSLPFDHLVFTGSTAVGRAVMKAASENLVPVTLELGGKSPTIVAKGSVQNRTVAKNVISPIRMVSRSQKRAVAASFCEANTQNSADRGTPFILPIPQNSRPTRDDSIPSSGIHSAE
jgi:acyl-CoA reductase-like NAD-dependent aldehyde dehydrogenase